MSDVFLDTNVLVRVLNREEGYKDTIKSLAKIKVNNFTFKMSCIVHFEILWGFSLYGGEVEKYENILKKYEFEIVPLTKEDVELASKYCNEKSRIRDYFIGATVKNRKGTLLTYNLSDFKWIGDVHTPEEFVENLLK
ncbi:PIN domain-containing protein [Geoglobus acetivorans]|uniref:PIN domain-containing protein n=1 Tax=Geoglobus acetivorans TaxID=565033 RepID=A0ABZ3H402_GEOAI|nr:PIN domain-containing protein [Geoglobus acetivorans]